MTGIKQITADFITSRGGSSKPNEDISLSLPWGAVIFDGATPLGPARVPGAESDAEWFVNTLAEEMNHRVEDQKQKTKNFKSLLEGSLSKVISEYRSRTLLTQEEFSLLKGHEMPSASMVAITLERGGVYGYGIGDCELLVKKKNTGRVVRVFRQHPVHRIFDEQSALIYSALRKGGKNHEEAREVIGDKLRANRKKSNKSNGYPILTLDLKPLQDVQKINLSQLFSLEPGDEVIICSDGVVPLYAGYGTYSLKELFDEPPEELIKKLREIEQGDPTCLQYPRLKVSDDATLGAVRFA